MVTHMVALFVDHLPMGVQELVTSKSITSYLLPSLTQQDAESSGVNPSGVSPCITHTEDLACQPSCVLCRPVH